MFNHYVDTAITRVAEQQCDKDVKDSFSGLNGRALCPWKLTIDCDSKRIPETLLKAECLNKTCQFPYPSLRNKLSTACEPVTTGILTHLSVHIV
jgi:hypothetical protein